MLIKNYHSNTTEKRYSPANIVSIDKASIFGNPDMDKASTSHVERLNLTLRMLRRRFTRLTNGFSKSPEHHEAMQSLFFAWYDFCRPHQSLKTEGCRKRTPAMASGLADSAWTIKRLLTDAAKAIAT